MKNEDAEILSGSMMIVGGVLLIITGARYSHSIIGITTIVIGIAAAITGIVYWFK